jgi:SpoVK/Ycf46/Vps4 family AAA+-type ATPase
MTLTGVYGCAKSEFAKRFAEEADTICVRFDLSAMKDSYVGNSEANLRQALRVITEIGGTDSGAVWIATANRINRISPEMRRRLNTLQTWFFYLPSATERKEIWKIYIKEYKIDEKIDFDDEGWTGAEIESCCRLAHLLNKPLAEAAATIVPTFKTAKNDIARIVQQAEGNFLCASSGGAFKKPVRKQSNKKTSRATFK